MPEFIEISDLFGETETVNPRHVQVRKDQIELVSFVMRAVQGRAKQIAHFQLLRTDAALSKSKKSMRVAETLVGVTRRD